MTLFAHDCGMSDIVEAAWHKILTITGERTRPGGTALLERGWRRAYAAGPEALGRWHGLASAFGVADGRTSEDSLPVGSARIPERVAEEAGYF